MQVRRERLVDELMEEVDRMSGEESLEDMMQRMIKALEKKEAIIKEKIIIF